MIYVEEFCYTLWSASGVQVWRNVSSKPLWTNPEVSVYGRGAQPAAFDKNL